MKRLTDKQRTALLKPIQSALSQQTRQTRADLFDRYMDEPYGDEVDGLSKYRSTDGADVVETVFAEAMEQLVGDDDLVEFVATGPQDEQSAELETKVIHKLFRDDENSFVVLSTWFKEGLIEQNAYLRSGWVERTKVVIDEYDDLSPDQFLQVYAGLTQQPDDYEIEELDGVEIDPVTRLPAFGMGKDGQPAPIHMRCRTVRRSKEYAIEPIPQNEFFVSPRWHKITLDGCPVCGHKAQKSRSDLIQMGFSRESIDGLPRYTESAVTINRHDTKGNDDATNGEELEAFEVFEAYVLADINGDGIDELVNVWTGGDGKTILQWKDGRDAVREVERRPFSCWTPYIVPHRHVGRSVMELAASIQQLKTVLWRQLLDNIYKTNHARPEVAEELSTENTLADINVVAPGAPIRVASPGALNWTRPPQIVGDVLPLLERSDADLEKHAGATRYAQGLGAEALGKTQIGSEGLERILDASMRRMQVIIRTFAETGLRDLFQRMHADLRRGPRRELIMQIGGDWQQINPMQWPERESVRVRIGTGRTDKHARRMALERVLVEIKEGVATGNPSFGPQQLYEAMKRLTKTLGLTSVDPFMADPKTLPPAPPPQPGPQDMAALALAQAETKKAEAAMHKAETDRAKAAAEMDIKRETLRLDAEIAAAKAREAEANLEIKRVELAMQQAQTVAAMNRQDEQQEAPGGAD